MMNRPDFRNKPDFHVKSDNSIFLGVTMENITTLLIITIAFLFFVLIQLQKLISETIRMRETTELMCTRLYNELFDNIKNPSTLYKQL